MQRKTSLFAISLGLLTLSTQAQNTSPFWSLAGNSNANSVSKLGTTTPDPLNITTNNLTRLRINSDGKVGIGTSSPQQLFHVEGQTLLSIFVSTTAPSNISGSGMIGYVKALPTAAGQRLGYFLTGSRGGAENNYNSAGMAGYAADGWTAGSSYPSYLTFETTPSGATARSERLRITSSGNVGIATTSPLAQLHVQGTASNSVLIGEWAASNVYSGISMSGSLSLTNYNMISGLSDQNLYINRPSGNFIRFRMANVDQMVLNGSGNLGIGTSSPAYRLEAVNNTTISPTAVVRNAYTAGTYTDGLYIYAGRDGTLSSTTSYLAGFYTPGGTNIGSISQTSTTSVAYNTTSDKRLKANIRETRFGLADVNKIQVRDYNFIGSKTEQTGFLAQQLYEIFPEAVSKGGDDPKTRPWMVDYGRITPLLVKAVQELSKENEELKQKVSDLEELKMQVAELKVLVAKNGNGTSINTAGAMLEQNIPNPSRGITTIRYQVPEGTASAKLILVNAKGQVLKEVNVPKGAGQTNLSTANLPAGVYTYTLVIDGQQAASRQLVIAR